MPSCSFGTYEQIWENCSVVVSHAGSGVCELTNQTRLGIREAGLKDTGVFQTEGEHSAAVN